MKRTIMPVKKREYDGKLYPVHIQIEYSEDGRLSLSGVVGAKSSGNCAGSCGQILDELKTLKEGDYELTDGFSLEDVQKLYEYWKEWHLNDMRPYCVHQKQLGWDKLASKKVTLYHYRLTREAQKMQELAKKSALNALKEGKTFTPSQEQVFFVSLPYSVTSHKRLSGDDAKYYEPKKPIYSGDIGFIEEKTLGWLKKEEHPDGILSKDCPCCGYKYGSAWIKEEVPQTVVEWLFSLPQASVKCAWNSYN